MSSFELASGYISGAYNNESSKGLVVVCEATKMDRVKLIVWAVKEWLGEYPDREQRTLYVTLQEGLVERVRLAFFDGYRKRNHIDIGAPERKRGRVVINYIVGLAHRGLIKQLGALPPESINLLIVDEREKGGLDDVAPLLYAGDPQFVLVLTSTMPDASSPWMQFGEPVIIPKGPAPADQPQPAD